MSRGSLCGQLSRVLALFKPQGRLGITELPERKFKRLNRTPHNGCSFKRKGIKRKVFNGHRGLSGFVVLESAQERVGIFLSSRDASKLKSGK